MKKYKRYVLQIALWLVLGSVVVGVGAIAALAWAVSTDGKKVRP